MSKVATLVSCDNCPRQDLHTYVFCRMNASGDWHELCDRCFDRIGIRERRASIFFRYRHDGTGYKKVRTIR